MNNQNDNPILDAQGGLSINTQNDNPIWDAHQVSEYFFQGLVSYDKVLRMTKAGDLPCLPIPNRYLYRLDILEEWARMNLHATAYSGQSELQ